ncbi:MAG: GNAT family N-acetyltransferase [Spirochaetales bacterium]|nr:GNAT family N-acetyltransferase [Spirochaetales bacterium]
MKDSLIRRIESNQLNDFSLLIRDVIVRLKSDGIDQWDEVYPSRADLAEDIQKKTAYGYFVDAHPAAYMVLNEEVEPQYDEVEWKFTEGEPLIIHRLSVHPEYKGMGIGRKLVEFAENEARARGYGAIRLDVFSLNPAALRLYERTGFRKAGDVLFRKGKFFLYEKKLS